LLHTITIAFVLSITELDEAVQCQKYLPPPDVLQCWPEHGQVPYPALVHAICLPLLAVKVFTHPPVCFYETTVHFVQNSQMLCIVNCSFL